jgi:hypothetical protein
MLEESRFFGNLPKTGRSQANERIDLKSSFETHLRQLMIEQLQNLATKRPRRELNLNPQKMISILAPRRIVV